MSHRFIVKGAVLEVHIRQLRRGCWVFHAEADANGDIVNDYASDPLPNEKECRKQAKFYADNAQYSREYGWHLP